MRHVRQFGELQVQDQDEQDRFDLKEGEPIADAASGATEEGEDVTPASMDIAVVGGAVA